MKASSKNKRAKIGMRRATFLEALSRKGSVMRAVMLRDMRTRFFNHGLGFLLVIIWPLAHMFVLLTIYSLFGRRAPFGDSLYIFFGTGLVPTLSFMYVSRQMAMSVVSNRPMLAFPAIHITDIIFGRATLEILGSFLMALTVFSILMLNGEHAIPTHIPDAIAALCATLLLAVGIGSLISLIAAVLPQIVTVYFLVIIATYLFSGTLFVPSYLPEQIIGILSWNPVMHGVEWMRTAYFIDYPRQVLSKTYLVSFGVCSLGLGLALERFLKPIFMTR
jgi:capsular polysaccharide transport system permease protein